MIYVLILTAVLLICLFGMDAVYWGIAILGGLYLFTFIFGWIVSPKFRKVIREQDNRYLEHKRQKKYAKKKYRKYPTDRMFRNYYRTGDRNYLWNENYRK